MKRLLSLAIFTLSVITSINAQEGNKTTFGLSFGLNQNFFATKPYSFEGLNFYGGAFMENKLSEKFSLKSELNFSRAQGNGYSFLEVPISLKYKINNDFSLKTGLQANYVFEDKNQYNITNINENLGLDATLGLEYNLSEKWYLDTKYIYRTTKQFKSPQVRMNVFRLGVGFRF